MFHVQKIPQTEWFSDYQQCVQVVTHDDTKTHKLAAHLYDRKHYTLHYHN